MTTQPSKAEITLEQAVTLVHDFVEHFQSLREEKDDECLRALIDGGIAEELMERGERMVAEAVVLPGADAEERVLFMRSVVNDLADSGWGARLENVPDRVVVDVKDAYTLQCGTANEYWGCDLCDGHDEAVWSFPLPVRSDERGLPAAARVALEIRVVLNVLVRGDGQ